MKNKQLVTQKNTLMLVLLALIALAIVGCNNDDDEPIPNLGTLEVQLQLATGLSDIPLADIPVKITNTTDNSETTENTDASGKAVFINVPSGTYSIEVATTTNEYTLGGTANNVTVVRQESTNSTIAVNANSSAGGLVIKEVYTVGPADNFVTLFKDQFIEIFNNSPETLFADGMYLANLFGQHGAAGDENPISTVLSLESVVYADVLDQIPGSGQDYPIASGKSIVIALNAVNFKEGNPTPDAAIDNTDATLERYSVAWLEAQGRAGNAFFDLDNPAVPNMTNIYIFENTDFYRLDVPGASVVLINSDASFTDSDIVDYTAPGSTATFKLMSIPVDKIVDGVDILENSQAADFKRLPASIDAGFNFINADGNPSYSGKSSRRKKDETASNRFGRTILQDTNNSTLDFEVIDSPDKYGYNQ